MVEVAMAVEAAMAETPETEKKGQILHLAAKTVLAQEVTVVRLAQAVEAATAGKVETVDRLCT